jgi:hypothetical protein
LGNSLSFPSWMLHSFTSPPFVSTTFAFRTSQDRQSPLTMEGRIPPIRPLFGKSRGALWLAVENRALCFFQSSTHRVAWALASTGTSSIKSPQWRHRKARKVVKRFRFQCGLIETTRA